jgi:hypothetical protein
MPQIKPQEDAAAIRRYLDSRVREIAASRDAVSAIEIGYEVSQAGWVYVHADCRAQHERDGEWTLGLNDNNVLELAHWVGADSEEAGQMILKVVQAARADGVFSALGPPGSIQLDIEDFNGGWAWPEFDQLGKTNLA